VVREFSMQQLSNLAWSCAQLGIVDEPLFQAISAAAIPKLAMPQALECALSPVMLLALVQSLASVEALSEAALDAAATALDTVASALDGAQSRGGVQEGVPREGMWSRSDCGPCMLFSSSALYALSKPPGWVVVVQNSEQSCDWRDEVVGSGRRLQDWITQRWGPTCPIAFDALRQHGIVHRLDRDTSGVLLCARTYRGYYGAQLSFAARRVAKTYICLCQGRVTHTGQKLDAPLQVVGRPGARQSVAVAGGLQALTELRSVGHLASPQGDSLSLVEVRLHTGRFHQIRAHLTGHGHPLVGDATYGGIVRAWCPRVFLHACRLRLECGGDSGGALDVWGPLPLDLEAALSALAAASEWARVRAVPWLGADARLQSSA